MNILHLAQPGQSWQHTSSSEHDEVVLATVLLDRHNEQFLYQLISKEVAVVKREESLRAHGLGTKKSCERSVTSKYAHTGAQSQRT